MDQFIAEIRKIPLVTRLLCASSLGVTVPVLMRAVSGYKFIFDLQLVTQKLEACSVVHLFIVGLTYLNVD